MNHRRQAAQAHLRRTPAVFWGCGPFVTLIGTNLLDRAICSIARLVNSPKVCSCAPPAGALSRPEHWPRAGGRTTFGRPPTRRADPGAIRRGTYAPVFCPTDHRLGFPSSCPPSKHIARLRKASTGTHVPDHPWSGLRCRVIEDGRSPGATAWMIRTSGWYRDVSALRAQLCRGDFGDGCIPWPLPRRVPSRRGAAREHSPFTTAPGAVLQISGRQPCSFPTCYGPKAITS